MQREVKSNCKYSNAQNISHPFSYALNARCIDVSMSIKCPLTLSKMKPLLIGAKFFISAIYQAIILLQLEVFLNAFFLHKMSQIWQRTCVWSFPLLHSWECARVITLTAQFDLFQSVLPSLSLNHSVTDDRYTTKIRFLLRLILKQNVIHCIANFLRDFKQILTTWWMLHSFHSDPTCVLWM